MKVTEPEYPEDMAKIMDLRYRVLRAPWGQPLGSESDDGDDTAIHALLKNEDGKVLAVGRLHFPEEGVGQIRYMAVDDEHQGKGFGGMIVGFLESKAYKLNTKRIFLNARFNAVNFYKHLGYTVIADGELLWGKIPHFVMEKHL